MTNDDKIKAIKGLRERVDVGLKAAKDAIEAHASEYPQDTWQQVIDAVAPFFPPYPPSKDDEIAALRTENATLRAEVERLREAREQTRIRVWNRALNACGGVGNERAADHVAAAFDEPMAPAGSPLSKAAREAIVATPAGEGR